MSCNQCNDHYGPCSQCGECPETMDACDCPQKDVSTDCSVYTGDNLPNSGISQNTVLTEVIQQLDAYIQNKFEEAIEYLTLVNVGGGAEVFKGINGIGNKELRSIEQGVDIIVTENTDTITITNPTSTEFQRGVAEIATQAETDAGVDDERIVTPLKLVQGVTTILADPSNLPDATESAKGIAEIATQVEVDAGTDDERFVTPLKLDSNLTTVLADPSNLPSATESAEGVAEIATQVEVDAGTDDVRFVTPLKLDSNLTTVLADPNNLPNATEAARGIAEIATQGEVDAGTDDEKIVTPLKLTTFVADPTNLPSATESAEGVAEIATQVEVDAGVDDTRFVTPLKLETRLAGGGVSIKATTVTLAIWAKNAAYSGLAHGLGVTPIMAHVKLRCKVPNNNYVVGDIVPVQFTGFDDDSSGAGGSNNDEYGIVATWNESNTTTYGLLIGGHVDIATDSGGGTATTVNVTETDWDLQVTFLHL